MITFQTIAIYYFLPWEETCFTAIQHCFKYVVSYTGVLERSGQSYENVNQVLLSKKYYINMCPNRDGYRWIYGCAEVVVVVHP